MKKISTLILLISFQFGAFAQADVTSTVLTNPGFEASTFDTGWTLVQNKGVATFTDGGKAEAFSGDHVGLVEVTDAQGIWELYLETTLNTTDFSNKDLEIAFKTKRLWTAVGAVAFKVQLFVGEPGGTNLVPLGHNGGNREQWYNGGAEDTYEDTVFTITVPSGVTQLVMQLWVGGKLGSYFFDDFSVTDVAALSVDDFELNAIEMYPNPTNGILNFDNNNGIKNIQISNVTGQMVQEVRDQQNINIQSLTPGVYFVKVELSNNQILVRKVIKK